MSSKRIIRTGQRGIHAALFLTLLALASHSSAQRDPLVQGVDAIGITVSDMDRAMEFYSKVLTFEKISDTEVAGENYEHLEGVFGLRMRVVRMRLGDEFIELTEYLAPKGRPIPVDSRSNDRWFQHIAIIVSDMDKVYAWLRRNKVEYASTEPQRLPDWNKNAAGISAFYFKDPDQHPVEVLQFPAGKGQDKWHRPTDRLFLGIDHTAIVVWDTDASVRFYRDLLGMHVAGESENYGTEQEHLNNVFGAHLRITGLRAASGPGIELLEYLSPRDGRPTPADLHANDLQHWQTVLHARDVRPATTGALVAGGVAVSADTVEVEDAAFRIHRGRLIRDPDGHGLLVAQ